MPRLQAFIAVAVFACVTSGCQKAEPETEPVAPVQVAPVTRGSIQVIVNADAVLYPREQANIVPKISAPVRRFVVNRGDHVTAGQLVAELEARDLAGAEQEIHGQLAQAESNLRSTSGATVPEAVTKAQTDVDAARAAMDAAKKLLDSRQQLFTEGALPRKQVDEAQVAYTQARAQFEAAQQHLQALQNVGKNEQVVDAQAQVESARGRLESAQAQVAYASIRSPLTGVVTDRPLYPGEMATTGVPLLTVMDISKMVARINMPPDQAKSVRVGNEATLTPSDGSDAVTGKVIIVSPATDANSTTVQVWVQVDNPGERLHAGQAVHASIVAKTIEDATLVPAAAIFADEAGMTIVKVVDAQNIAHDRPVQVGAREPDKVQVEGVQPNERVIVEGGVGLDDKAQVRIVTPEDAKSEDAKPEGGAAPAEKGGKK
jgi:HlyD family secretion protein